MYQVAFLSKTFTFFYTFFPSSLEGTAALKRRLGHVRGTHFLSVSKICVLRQDNRNARPALSSLSQKKKKKNEALQNFSRFLKLKNVLPRELVIFLILIFKYVKFRKFPGRLTSCKWKIFELTFFCCKIFHNMKIKMENGVM